MVEFQTTFSAKTVDNFAKYQLKKSVWIFVAISAVFIVAGILFIVFTDSFFDDDGLLSLDVLIGIILILSGIILFPIFLYSVKHSQKNANSTMSILSDQTYSVFTFDENQLTISQKKGDTFEAFTKAKYDYLFKVVETKTNYFLYISSAQCHVIDKASLTQGSLDEFNTLLLNNLQYRFKPMKKKFN
ncbi:MAG: YcxB family protein [Clostridia bacterium]|nr:YcxB family protein [Clostridia bacterium]